MERQMHLRVKLETLLDDADSVHVDSDIQVSRGEDGAFWISGFRLLEITPEGRMFVHGIRSDNENQ